MSKKSGRVEAALNRCGPPGVDPHYWGFFERFNRGEYFEAHDVLEQLWLKDRYGSEGRFYKGLIQLAGAFVHVTKRRRGPALALFKLAEDNLSAYPRLHLKLDLERLSRRIACWQAFLEMGGDLPELENQHPALQLEP